MICIFAPMGGRWSTTASPPGSKGPLEIKHLSSLTGFLFTCGKYGRNTADGSEFLHCPTPSNKEVYRIVYNVSRNFPAGDPWDF